MLFITINDWPTLSNLSGQINKGYKACTHCLDQTDSIYLPNCKKNVYLEHRRFLWPKHPLRKRGKHFNDKADPKPAERTGADVFNMVKDIKVTFGKGPGGVSVPKDADGRAPMWKKNSIFWELPYLKFLEVRNAIDVMHVTKNLCVNLLGLWRVRKVKRYTGSTAGPETCERPRRPASRTVSRSCQLRSYQTRKENLF